MSGHEAVVLEFEKLRPTYERFTEKLEYLLSELLENSGLDYTLESRTKSVNSFKEKFVQKSYEDPLRQIQDLSGLRIILRRSSDIPKLVSVIEKEFTVDRDNSVFKADLLNVNQFGYTSVHLIVSVSKERARLSEWRSFEGLQAEIQLRTFLQHAWANISHEFDYKMSDDVPRQLRRKLFRLAALVELADEELDTIVDEVNVLTNQYRSTLEKGDTNIEINVDSLRTYVETSPEVAYWNNFLRENTGQRVESWGDLSRDVRIAHYCGLNFISEIDNVLKNAHGWGERFFLDYYQKYFEKYKVTPDKTTTVLNGTLAQLLIANFSEKFTQEILNDEFGYGTPHILESARIARNG